MIYYIKYRMAETAKMEASVMAGIILALEIFKRPSNTQMQIDSTKLDNGAYRCNNCGTILLMKPDPAYPCCD